MSLTLRLASAWDASAQMIRVEAVVKNLSDRTARYRLVHWGGHGTTAHLPSVELNGAPLEGDETWFTSLYGGELPALEPEGDVTVSISLLARNGTHYGGSRPRSASAILYDADTQDRVAFALLELPEVPNGRPC